MATEKHIIDAPRIEVVAAVCPGGEADEGPYDMYLVLHVPDGRPPTIVTMPTAAALDRDRAIEMMLDCWTWLGERYAIPDSDLMPDRPQ